MREIQIVTTLKWHLHPSDWQKFRSLTAHRTGEAVEKLAFSYIAGGNQNGKAFWG